MKKFIKNVFGEYKLTLITKDNMYYVNEEECDENACVIMLNKKGIVISDNYFAFSIYMETLEKIVNNCESYEFIDSSTLKLATKYFNN